MVGMGGASISGRGPRARGHGEGRGSAEDRLPFTLPLATPLRAMRTTLRLDLPSVHAVRAVYTALQGIEGIVQADVSRTGAVIEHDGGATPERLRQALQAAGYDVAEIIEERRRLIVRDE